MAYLFVGIVAPKSSGRVCAIKSATKKVIVDGRDSRSKQVYLGRGIC